MAKSNILRLADFLKPQANKSGTGGPTSAEGLALLKAFMKIRDPKRRAAIVAMAVKEAGRGARADGEGS